jgi:hypothetical protein
MKKCLAVLLALVVAGGVFAQEFKFTGFVNGGIGLRASNAEDNPTTPGYDESKAIFIPYAVEGPNALRVELNGAYTNADKIAGANFRLRWNGSSSGVTDAFEFGYAWVKAFDMLTLYGGKVDNGTFNSMAAYDGDQGEGFGALSIFSLKDVGLDLGLGIYSGGTHYDASTSPQGSGMDFENTKFTFNAALTVPDLIKVVVSARTKSALKTAATDLPTGLKGGDNSARAGLGLNVLALADAGITRLALDAFLDNLQDSDLGYVQIGERVEFAKDTLTIGARFRQSFLIGKQKDDTSAFPEAPKPYLNFWVWVSYGLMENAVVPRLDVSFISGGKHNYNFKTDGFGDPSFDKASSLELRPQVEFRFGGTAAVVQLGYSGVYDLTDGAKAGPGVSTMDHLIFANYKVSF